MLSLLLEWSTSVPVRLLDAIPKTIIALSLYFSDTWVRSGEGLEQVLTAIPAQVTMLRLRNFFTSTTWHHYLLVSR